VTAIATAPVRIQDDQPTREQARESARALFRQLAELPAGPERNRIRTELIEMHLPLVRYFARRYVGRGEPLDDLLQAGSIGLVKAVDRFDPSRGLEFSTYASPTILGEIRRHFRDRTWAVHVHRNM
jgi:RNA polymerase sigma-B factor